MSSGCWPYMPKLNKQTPLRIFSSSSRRPFNMTKKLTGKALARFEAGRDIWQEVLDGVRQIKAGRGARSKVEPRSVIARARLESGLTQEQFAALLGVSRRTLEQWEQGRREPSG